MSGLMWPLLPSCSSGSIAAPAGRALPRSLAASRSWASGACAVRSGLLQTHGTAVLSATSPSASVEGNASLAGPVFAAQNLVLGVDSSRQSFQALDASGSSAAEPVEAPALGWGSGDRVRARTLDATALRTTGASTPHVHGQQGEELSRHLDGAGRPGPPGARLAPTAAADPPQRPWPTSDDGDPPVASTSAPDRPTMLPGYAHRRRPGGWGAPAGRGGDGSGSAGDGTPSTRSSRTVSSHAPALVPEASDGSSGRIGGSRAAVISGDTRGGRPAARAPAEPPRAPRPRLLPPPAPLTWPDYPYARRPAASAASPSDTAALKLEALFQAVLHYPRVPPKLLRFLQRTVPGGVAGALPHVTATVERLAAVCGREVAVYLIRRRPWVVLVAADWIVPRIEAVRQMLGLPPGAMLDMLRKNPNLLRMERATLRARYEALGEATDFEPDQVRALVIKYPLILNFQPDSVASAAAALRRLCRARPSWAAHHDILSPSQFAFFMRDRVHTLLRLEYLLITGSGGSWTVRDIIKASNNMFKKVYTGFRSWSTERLRRLHERMQRVRDAAEAEARAERDKAAEAAAQAEAAAAAEYGQDEARRFSKLYSARRRLELAAAEHREVQRKVALELKQQQQREAAQEPGETGSVEEEEEEVAQAAAPPKRRPGRREEQRARDAAAAADGADGGRGSVEERPAGWLAASAPLAGARAGGPADGPAQAATSELVATGGSWRRTTGAPSAPRAPVDGDALSALSPGRVWQRPGSKVQPAGAEGSRAGPYRPSQRPGQQQQQQPGRYSEPRAEQPQQQQPEQRQPQQWGTQDRGEGGGRSGARGRR